VIASVLLAMACGEVHQAAAAPRLLETLTVPAAPSTPVTTKTTLKQGRQYTLEVRGIVTSSTTRPDGVTIGEREDAFYCFEELNEAAVSPTSSCTKNIRYLGALRARIGGFNDFVETALGIQGRIPYQPSHAYVVGFRAPRTGALSFVSSKLITLSLQGSFQLKLYGSAAKKKKRKKKKKRITGCPAARASGPQARAASACHWEVSFHVEQKGVPAASTPAPGTGFVETETNAVGKIFFNAKPKPGRYAAGRPAAVIVHTETYQSAFNPFSFLEGEVRTTPLSARYRYGGREAEVRIAGVVTSVTGVVYGKSGQGHSTAAGDRGSLAATVDFPFHRDDFLDVRYGCSACEKEPSGIFGLHLHRFDVGPNNKLRVTIGPPRQLAGSCRCRGTTP